MDSLVVAVINRVAILLFLRVQWFTAYKLHDTVITLHTYQRADEWHKISISQMAAW